MARGTPDEAPPDLSSLPERFREEAAQAEPYSRRAAWVWRRAADELERALGERHTEMLTITRAAEETGWSYEALRRRVVADPILNAGVPGAPAIRRGDLAKLGPPRRSRSESRGVQVSVPRPQEVTRTGSSGAASPSTPFERIKQRATRIG